MSACRWCGRTDIEPQWLKAHENLCHDQMRYDRRMIVMFLLIIAAIVAVTAFFEIRDPELIDEVTLDPIVVTLEDPFPCSTNPLHRLAFQRQGAVCRALD